MTLKVMRSPMYPKKDPFSSEPRPCGPTDPRTADLKNLAAGADTRRPPN